MLVFVGVLIVMVWCMNEWRMIKELFVYKYWLVILLFVFIMICIVIFDLSIVIVIGIISGCVFFVVKSVVIMILLEIIDW